MAVVCEQCGKALANRRAYAGHMLLAHQKRVGILAEVEQKVADMSQVRQELIADMVRLQSSIGVQTDVILTLAQSLDPSGKGLYKRVWDRMAECPPLFANPEANIEQPKPKKQTSQAVETKAVCHSKDIR